MEEVSFLSCEEVAQRISEADPAKLVFWVGAGIDIKYPSRLPKGDDLREVLLDKALDTKLAQKINNAWADTYKKLKKVLGKRLELSELQRLETIIECIRLFENNLLPKRYSLLSGLNCFSKVPPNSNHYALAYMLDKGASIVTTNYEDCIIQAYAEITKGEAILTLSYADKDSSLYIFSSTNPAAGKLYYLHGIASDLDRIGISLSTVKNGVGNAFKVQLESWIKSDSLVIYIGYSGSDSLDINPVIKSLPSELGSTAIYSRYVTDLDNVSHAITMNESILLHPFREKVVCFCNTDLLYMFLPIDPPRLEDYQWEEEFKENILAPYSENLNYTLMLGILYTLNINVKSIFSKSDYKRAENYGSVQDWYINYHCFRVAQMSGDLRTMRKYAKKYIGKGNLLLPGHDISTLSPDAYSMLCEYNAARGFGTRAIRMHKKPSELATELNNLLDRNIPIGWSFSTPYNRFLSGVIIRVSICPLCYRRIARKSRNEANILIADLSKIVDKGYSCVLSANQINTALRTLGLAAIFYNNDFTYGQQLIENAIENYGSTTYIHGLSGTFIYSAYAYCIQYLHTKDKKLWLKAREEIRYAREIAKVSDDKTLKKKLLLGYIFLSTSRVFHSIIRL